MGEWFREIIHLAEAVLIVDSNDDGKASNEEMDFWVDNYLDFSDADSELENFMN